MFKIIILFLLLSEVIFSINSSFFTPSITQTNYFSFGLKANFDTKYYFYKPSPIKISIPFLEGNLKLGKRGVFNIKYEYLMLDKSEIESETQTKIEKKSNANVGENFVIGGGDIITSIQFNLGQIKLGNTDLLIETKWPDAEYESGFGTDMTDLNFRFINSYFYHSYHITLNYGMKVLSNPNSYNTQSDFFTFGTTYQYSDFMASINEDIGRYNHQHYFTDFKIQYQYKLLLINTGISYTNKFVNKMFGFSMILD